jgi:hypothetical protein
MCRSTIIVMAPIPGLAVYFVLTIGCQMFAETPGERLRLALTLLSLPLSILTIWLVDNFLKWVSGNSYSSSSTNARHHREPDLSAIRCMALLGADLVVFLYIMYFSAFFQGVVTSCLCIKSFGVSQNLFPAQCNPTRHPLSWKVPQHHYKR